MSAHLKPRTAQDVCDAIKWAVVEKQPLEVLGQGSKRGLGRPVQAAYVLDLSEVSGVVNYEPAELVLTARAGTPIFEIEKLLCENGQELSFEPMDYGPLHGLPAGQGTLGGVLAANLSGPRRIKSGAARDHVLGMEAVSGRGEIFNSGGRVVKNVTGYDLPRGFCGSWGTLAVATTLTLKVNPAPETAVTFQLTGLSDEEAVRAMTSAMGSSAEVSGAAHIPQDANGEVARTVLRLEGFQPSVEYRFDILKKRLADFGQAERISGQDSARLWQEIRDCSIFAGETSPVWRLSVAPASGPELVQQLRKTLSIQTFYDWSGGLIWLRCLDGQVHADQVRQAVRATGGGHATLVRADASIRNEIEVFQPQPAPLAALSSRLKQQFDPCGILNPARMSPGL